jgi:PHD/YefM family antitoxin component YafN of YafNO toxin-antitoxin module
MEARMGTTSLTSRELSHSPGRAKNAAEAEPVFITDRGRPLRVLMTYGELNRLIGKRPNLFDTLSMPGLSSIDVDPPRSIIATREIDFS